MALTELQIKHLKPKEKRYTVSDGRGLILEIHPNGSKYWILLQVSPSSTRRLFC